jgi:glycine cleavage system H protein
MYVFFEIFNGGYEMKIDEYDLPDDLYYHVEHTYAKVEGDLVHVGVTDFAQKMAGTIKRVVTLEEDDEVQQGKPFGTMSSGKWTGKLYSPISGEIVEVNEELEDEPKLINDSPYGEGWIVKIKPSDSGELDKLMKPGDDFAKWMNNEIEEKKKLLEGD